MSGIIMLLFLEILELIFLFLDWLKKSNHRKEKSLVRIALLGVFIILIISPIINWSFRWYGIGLFLTIQGIIAVITFITKKQNNQITRKHLILAGAGRCFFISFLIFPAILFPQYSPILPNGSYSVGTSIYTWTNQAREESFTDTSDHRKVTVQFYYPSDENSKSGTLIKDADIAGGGKYPLVIFSHGAFGYRKSNYSTYLELAIHGYVVCSIDHTYHAFLTKEEDGNTVLVNQAYIKEVMDLQNNLITGEEAYNTSQKWLKLRTEDMNFVLDNIITLAHSVDSPSFFQGIDLEHIGTFGHSLGGATAAQIGRDRKEVDAVIVIDGTMLGEVIGFKDGKEILNNTTYPKPILNFYNESHYADAVKNQDNYANMVVVSHAQDTYQVIINGSGHLNFTDLPLVSPVLAGLLGTGDVNAERCIEIMNQDILEFFDHYLKQSNTQINKVRIY